ncbi:MAG: TolC family protein, partial [Myxococcota bacterium]
AEIDLNRILAVPLERSFTTVDPDEGRDELLIDPRANRYVKDLYSFRIFRGFMADEARNNSPELRQLDAQIAAQDNLLTGYRRQLFLPTVAASFGFTNVLNRAGAGSQDPDPTVAPLPRDDFTWQGGLNLSFTLYDDIRYGTIQRIERVRAQLVAQRLDVSNRIEQGVRSALHQAGASGATVGLRRDAVEAARVNLEAVTDAYSQGTVSIITLIDAQNQALLAEINAANALYQYLSDFAAAERASGRFLILEPPAVRDDFFQRLEAFAAQMKADSPQGDPR